MGDDAISIDPALVQSRLDTLNAQFTVRVPPDSRCGRNPPLHFSPQSPSRRALPPLHPPLPPQAARATLYGGATALQLVHGKRVEAAPGVEDAYVVNVQVRLGQAQSFGALFGVSSARPPAPLSGASRVRRTRSQTGGIVAVPRGEEDAAEPPIRAPENRGGRRSQPVLGPQAARA
jgi:hypothetical protein